MMTVIITVLPVLHLFLNVIPAMVLTEIQMLQPVLAKMVTLILAP